MQQRPAQALMAQETRVRFGPAPRRLSGDELGECSWAMAGDEFLLRGDGGHWFHYRRGEGVTIERGPGADASAETLWLNGSVYAAIACMHGLMPIHASAVAWGGKAWAFTGVSGAGKSTLAAALGRHGLPMFCDDTLVLDLSDPDSIVCLPGHKRLKLTAEAIGLSGARAEEEVGGMIEKSYAQPPGGDVREPLTLGGIFFLEQGPEARIAPIGAGERIARLNEEDHNTARLFQAANPHDPGTRFRLFARIAAQVQMARFVRPRDVTRFDEGIAVAANHVKRQASSITG